MPLHTRSDQSQILAHEECIMKKVLLFTFLFLPFPAYAQQAPFGRPDIPISSRDRVYAADQTSNTVSVIDPSRNELLGVIRLGNPVPGSLSPLYTAQLLVQITAAGLFPGTQYEVFLAEHKDESFGKLVPLAISMTNPDTAGSVQAIGPLKKLAEGAEEEHSRFLIVTELNNPSNVVLRQSDRPSSSSGAVPGGSTSGP